MTPSHPLAASAFHLFRALRPNQWTKNLVVVAPFIFALGDQSQSLSAWSFGMAAVSCGLFCLLSSGIYLFNDILDRESDRLHPVKRFRPIASGAVSVPCAGVLSACLLAASLTCAFVLAPSFGAVAATYVVMQAAYTLWLKHIALVDVFVIAAGFVLRAVAGGVTLKITLSPWLLLCAFLLALFLGLCKRRHEKYLSDNPEESRPSLDQYHVKLLDQLIAIVSAAVIVCYSIYTLWPETTRKFGTSLLALTIPFVIFGIFRYLDLVYRKDAGGRPEKVLLTDLPLQADLLLYTATVVLVFTLT